MKSGTKQHLILASQSPRRIELLGRFNLAFETISADLDETRLPGESPQTMTERLAVSKARAVLSGQSGPVWILAGDTCVAQGDEIFDKPSTVAEAKATLTQLSGAVHQVITSMCILSAQQQRVATTVSQVTFGKLDEAMIDAYCASDEPYDKAGAYGIQQNGGKFVSHIDGDYSAIVGMPLWVTGQLLRYANFEC